MKKNAETILDKITLPQGMEIDLDEGWKKLISRQFGGSPGRGFNELIQNLLDSYPSDTPWADRRGEIVTGNKNITITDYGEGMNRSRLKLLTTLGGTDKNNDPSKIGTFGIGFVSIFNPGLGTKKVRVITRCEGQTVELVFLVKAPGKRPEIRTRILDEAYDFSTRIEVSFDNSRAPGSCLDYAEKCLHYYPCQVMVNGRPCQSIWEQARARGLKQFKDSSCEGFLEDSGGCGFYNSTTVLCKYEHIISTDISCLITGGRNYNHDLRDYYNHDFPFVPGVSATVNCNNLSVTISRDSFWLDSAHRNMVQVLADAYLEALEKYIRSGDDDLIIANHFALRSRIKTYLTESKETPAKAEETPQEKTLRRLAEAKVYRINGRKEHFSLLDIQAVRNPDLPVYFSPDQSNLNWLGGAFKHDFIILPPRCRVHNGAPDFYDQLFGKLFDDVVNLDTVKDNHSKLRDLVERDIVDQKALSPTCKIVGDRRLKVTERDLLDEIDTLLADDGVKKVIAEQLCLPIKSIRTAFFDVDAEGVTVATGLFEEDGSLAGSLPIDNFHYVEEDGEQKKIPLERDMVLGLQRDNYLVGYLVNSSDAYRAYYTLTFLAHELAMCQKMLVPYSRSFHIVKERLARELRRVLMERLLNDGEQKAA